MLVLIVGASGMLGLNTVDYMVEQGFSVRCLVRRTNALLSARGVDLFCGDVMDPQFLRDSMEGCSAVIHLAADTSQDHLSVDDYLPSNVEFPLLVCRVAGELGLKVVFVSSANTVGNGSALALASEDIPASAPFTGNLYAQSKILAEQRILALGTDVSFVNPGFIIGAFDHKPSSGALLRLYYGRSLIFVPCGGKSFVAARDVARVIHFAVEQGERGQRYLAVGENLSFKEFFMALREDLGCSRGIVVIPRFLIYAIGLIGSLLRLLGVHTPVSLSNARIMATREYYKSKYVDHLATKNIEGVARESLKWMVDNGIIKRKIKRKTEK